MKRIFITFTLSSLSVASIAQCAKNVIYNSGKADFIDSLGNIIHTKQGKITVTLSKKDFVLMHDGDEEDALRGTVKNLACEWKDAYKNGKPPFESELFEKSGEKNDAVVSIEGKEGNLLIMVRFKTKDMILKIIPGSYTEVKE
ncbi:MAG: hypothetical protein ABI834_09845 [Ginsengibacter sp.]